MLLESQSIILPNEILLNNSVTKTSQLITLHKIKLI